MRRLLCRLIGHDYPVPMPTPKGIDSWVKGGSLGTVYSTCRRCGHKRGWG